MKWYAVKKEYIDYLKKWDKKVPNVDYGNRMKCFIGVIFIKNDIEYFAPLTSFKEKFISMKNDIDFYKITNYETGKIYGAIDINNMIPIPNEMYMHDYWIGTAADYMGQVCFLKDKLIGYRRHSSNVTQMTHGSIDFMVKKRIDIIRCLGLLKKRVREIG